ncbi:MAG: SUMF1/EgtB/PvdO family nonheme iron enzyme [Planctomycetes bacterium]|nr:SUMF1/EgtB/PvdO family nonheme iron enzyme [Planctomycetota bacterium]
MFCPQCGTPNPDDAAFCTRCSRDLAPLRALTPTPPPGRLSIGGLPTGSLATAAAVETLAAGTVVDDRYEIGALLGRGGMAAVYRSRDRKLEREVALKVISARLESTSEGVARFLQEGRAIATLNHANIVSVYDVGECPQGHYISMELVPDGTLSQRLADRGPIPPAEALPLVKAIAQALSHAHRKGVIHRDLKPSNVLLTREGLPKVADFGLARMAGSDLSSTGYAVGTLYYMAPEQRQDAKGVDHRADLFSLGATVYHILTGDVPVAPRETKLPDRWRSAVWRAMEPNREDRPFTVDEFLAEVETAMTAPSGGRPGATAPSSGTPLAGRASRGGPPEGTCPQCDFTNPEDVRYCKNCGTGLFEKCPKCGREDRVGTRHCGGCGLAIAVHREVQDALAKAKAHRESGALGRAEKEYHRALEAEGSNEEARRGLAEATELQQRIARAMGEASALEVREEYETAEARYQEVLKWNPREEAAQQALLALPEKGRARDARRLECAAEAAHGRGDYEKAIEQARRAIELDPELAAAREIAAKSEAALAEARRLAEEAAESERAAEAARREKARAAEAALRELECAAEAAHGQGDFAKAKASWEEALTKAPGDAKAKEGLRRAEESLASLEALMKKAAEQLRRKEWRGVIATCVKIEGLRKGHPEASAIRHMAEAEIAKAEPEAANAEGILRGKSFESARAVAQAVLAADPENERAKKVKADAEAALRAVEEFWRRGEAALRERRYADAIASFRKAIEIEPNPKLAVRVTQVEAEVAKAESKAAEADGMLRQKLFEAAREAAQKVLAVDPWNERAKKVKAKAESALRAIEEHWRKGEAALQGRLYVKAIVSFGKAIEIQPNPKLAARLEEVRRLEKRRRRTRVLAGVAVIAISGIAWVGYVVYENLAGLVQARQEVAEVRFGDALGTLDRVGTLGIDSQEKASLENRAHYGVAIDNARSLAGGGEWEKAISALRESRSRWGEDPSAANLNGAETAEETSIKAKVLEDVESHRTSGDFKGGTALLTRLGESFPANSEVAQAAKRFRWHAFQTLFAQAQAKIKEGPSAAPSQAWDEAIRLYGELTPYADDLVQVEGWKNEARAGKLVAEGYAALRRSDPDGAERMVSEAEGLVPGYGEAKPLRETVAKHRQEQRQVAEAARERRYQEGIAEAERQIRAKEWDKAMIAVRAALAERSADSKALRLKDEIEQAVKRYEDAMGKGTTLKGLCDLEAGLESVSKAIARLRREQDGEAAIKGQLELARQCKKWVSDGIVAVDEALSEKPRDKAATELTKVLDVERRYYDAIELALVAMVDKEWSKALDATAKALEVKAGDATATALKDLTGREVGYARAMERARGGVTSKDWPGAVAAVMEALGVKPNDATARSFLAEVEDKMWSGGVATVWLDVPNDVKMRLVLISAGEFMMGSREFVQSSPVRKVTLTKDYWIAETEVTQRQWRAVMGANPLNFRGDDLPVEAISWEDCKTFLGKLNGKVKDQIAGKSFGLPTEAEWEFACRAGSVGMWSFGNFEGDLEEYAWVKGNSEGKTHPVGGKKPNGWALYDMHGNVWEWCEDWYGEYGAVAITDPEGARTGDDRVMRGGSWNDDPDSTDSAARHKARPSDRFANVGLRAVLR